MLRQTNKWIQWNTELRNGPTQIWPIGFDQGAKAMQWRKNELKVDHRPKGKMKRL